MKILTLDISSHTGWAFFARKESKLELKDYGTISVERPHDLPYPEWMLEWVHQIFDEIEELIKNFKPEVLVIEETSKGSKNHLSQKMLEWCHYQLAALIVEEGIDCQYFMTGAWRVLVGAKMTKSEKDQNKKIKTANQKGVKVVKENGKRIGKITKKHVNVRIANENFNLKLLMKQNNEADAICLGLAYDTLLKNQPQNDLAKADVEFDLDRILNNKE